MSQPYSVHFNVARGLETSAIVLLELTCWHAHAHELAHASTRIVSKNPHF